MLTERHKERMQREDRRAGELLALTYNVNRDPKADPKGATWKDFYPEWDQQEPMSEEDMYHAMMMWTEVKPLPS